MLHRNIAERQLDKANTTELCCYHEIGVATYYTGICVYEQICHGGKPETSMAAKGLMVKQVHHFTEQRIGPLAWRLYAV